MKIRRSITVAATVVTAALAAAAVTPAASAHAGGLPAPTCAAYALPVRIADPGPADQTMWGQLCYRGDREPGTVQLLVHGATYNHLYWNFPYGNGYYSYVDAATAAGYATFDIDRIGAWEQLASAQRRPRPCRRGGRAARRRDRAAPQAPCTATASRHVIAGRSLDRLGRDLARGRPLSRRGRRDRHRRPARAQPRYSAHCRATCTRRPTTPPSPARPSTPDTSPPCREPASRSSTTWPPPTRPWWPSTKPARA